MDPDFVDLLRTFIAADVRFLVVGAYALAHHGRPRATGDLDEAWPGREAGTFGDVTVDFIGREAFIRNKRATGRAKDLGDIEGL
jgi:hypothetical protein